MPPTPVERERYWELVMAGGVMPEQTVIWGDGTTATEDERRSILDERLRGFFIEMRGLTVQGAQRRARQLLQSMLSADQLRSVKSTGTFLVVADSGRGYRLCVKTGRCFEVEKHGKRWYWTRSLCLHPPGLLPPADRTLSQLLLIRADEAEFLRRANVGMVQDQLWNGEYLRRVARPRRAWQQRGE